jgi:hypothetical protein
MTVSELINQLSKLPQNAEVIAYNEGIPYRPSLAYLVVVRSNSNLEDLGYEPGDELVVIR